MGADPEGFVDFYRRDHPAAAGMPMWRTGSGDVAAGLISELSTSALIPGAGSGTVVANKGLGNVCRHDTSVGLRLRAKTKGPPALAREVQNEPRHDWTWQRTGIGHERLAAMRDRNRFAPAWDLAPLDEVATWGAA